MRQLGAKNFYNRPSDQRWIDSTVTPEMEAKAIKVVQFSDAYFELAQKHGRKLSQYLAVEEPILLNIDGQAYCIDPPAGQ